MVPKLFTIWFPLTSGACLVSCSPANELPWWQRFKSKDHPCQLAADICLQHSSMISRTMPDGLGPAVPSKVKSKTSTSASSLNTFSQSAHSGVSLPFTQNSSSFQVTAPSSTPTITSSLLISNSSSTPTPFLIPSTSIPQSSQFMASASPSQPTSSASTSIPSSSFRATSSNAGAIAGGIVGGALFLALVTIGVLYFRRRRIQRRVAPSAEFMFLAGSGASYSRTLNDSPPPEYIMRNTPDPVLEKAYRSAEAQRRLDSNDSSVAAWEHPV